MNLKPSFALQLLLCIVLPAMAQTTTSEPQKTTTTDDVVKITTNLVQVDVVVTKDGKLVPNLTAEDFEIFQDGRKQQITSFTFISNVPTSTSQHTDSVPLSPIKRDDPHRTIAFVVDDLALSNDSMVQVKEQLRKFFAEQLQPNDLVAVLRTSGELGALQQFTNDKRVLSRAVDHLRWNFCNRVGIQLFLPAGVTDFGGGCGSDTYRNTLKSLRFIIQAMGQLPGRKSLVVFSDSMPTSPEDDLFFSQAGGNQFFDSNDYTELLYKLAESAVRSSVVIYSVDTQGLAVAEVTAVDSLGGIEPVVSRGRDPFGGSINRVSEQMRNILTERNALLESRRKGGELLAVQTGGFQIRHSNDFQLDRIAEDQTGYYLLGYRPAEETFNRRFHHIKAKVKHAGMTLRTRFGFFGLNETEAPRPLSNRDLTHLALVSPFGPRDIEVDLTSFFIEDKAAGPIVRSFVYINPEDLKFVTIDGKRQVLLELQGALFGENGAVVAQHARAATISLFERDYEYVMRNGIATRFDIPVRRPGSYLLRIAMRDKASSKIGSAGHFVEVPDLTKKRPVASGIVLATAARFAGRDANQIIQGTGMRKFQPKSDLYFALVTYNAASIKVPVMVVRLLRDSKSVYVGPETPIELKNQPDRNRLSVNGWVQLAPELEPGSYYLQVVISDKGTKNNAAQVVQWIDFEVVK